MIIWLHTQKHPCKIVIDKDICKLKGGINYRHVLGRLLTWTRKGEETILSFRHSSETSFYRKLPGGSAYPADAFVITVLCCRELHISINTKIVFLLITLKTEQGSLFTALVDFTCSCVKYLGLIWYSSSPPSASLPKAFIKTAESGTRDMHDGKLNVHFLCSPYCQVIQWLCIFYNPQPQYSGMS